MYGTEWIDESGTCTGEVHTAGGYGAHIPTVEDGGFLIVQ